MRAIFWNCRFVQYLRTAYSSNIWEILFAEYLVVSSLEIKEYAILLHFGSDIGLPVFPVFDYLYISYMFVCPVFLYFLWGIERISSKFLEPPFLGIGSNVCESFSVRYLSPSLAPTATIWKCLFH